ncbi:MAG: hypothetical protein OEL79_03470 [Chromatiales bacterium]|nr:hypothetical protein [Chromatiales bacterium]
MRQKLNYRPISLLEMTMRQTLEGVEDFASDFGFGTDLSDIDFELLDTHAVEAMPTKTISQPFTARILRFPRRA